MSKFFRLTSLAVLVVLATAGTAATAQEESPLNFHGFVSQGASRSSLNNVGGESADGWSLDMHELGVGAIWRPAPSWLVSGQVLSRQFGSGNDPISVDFAMISKTLLTSDTAEVGIRAGRVKVPYGFFNTTRDVAHTRPGILLPQSIYYDRIRDFQLGADGASLYGTLQGEGAGSWAWHVGALKPQADSPEMEYTFLLFDRLGHFDGRASWAGQVAYESETGDWRAALSYADWRMGYTPGGPPGFNPFTQDVLAGKTRLPSWVGSFEYNAEDWTLTAEYSQTKVAISDYGPIMPDGAHTTEGYYVQGTYRVTPSLSVFARRDVLYMDKNDKNGSQFGHPNGLPDYFRYTKDFTLGVRKAIGEVLLSAEWHQMDGTAILSLSENTPGSMRKSWDLYLLQAAWRF